MIPVHWIVQENQGNFAEVSRLVSAIESEGQIPHLVHLTKSHDIPPIPDLPDEAPAVCHGPGFVTRAPRYPRLKSGLFFDHKAFCWQAFSRGWAGAMLSKDARVATLSETLDLLRNGVSAFVRPDADSKLFDGGVYDGAGLVTATNNGTVFSDTPVIVASPLAIEAEWRFFVVNREIVGCSEYRCGGRPSSGGTVPQSPIDLATELVLRWSPAPIYCLDLAATDERIGVVEANCFNASRFYGAAVERIVRSVSEYVSSGR